MMETIFYGLMYFVGSCVLALVGVLCLWTITCFVDVVMKRIARRLRRKSMLATDESQYVKPGRPDFLVPGGANRPFSPAPPAAPGVKISRVQCHTCGECFDSWEGFIAHLKESER